MGGIFGCLQLDGAPINVAAAGRCAAHLNGHSRSSSPTSSRDVAFGFKRSIGSETGVSDSGEAPVNADVQCVFDGRLDNRDELQRTLAAHPTISSNCPDWAFVAAAYERFGDAFPRHLKGDFVAAVFDRRSKRLLVARDRVGVRPLCYAMPAGAVVFASDAKALLQYPGVRAAPDTLSLADFILGFRSRDCAGRTFFRDIQTLPPAHLLTATPLGVTVRPYCDFDVTRRLHFPAFLDYVFAFHEIFVNAVRRRLQSAHAVGISVSGGLDSAYIFCAAHRMARAERATCPMVLGYNFEGPVGTPSDERTFVETLERECHAPIHRIAQRPGFIDCAASDVWSAESPMLDRLAHQARAATHALRAAGVGRVLTGHWGDQLLFDADYVLDLLFSGKWRLLHHHAAGWHINGRRLARRALRGVVVRYAPDRLLSAVRRRRGGPDAPWRSPLFTRRFRQVLKTRAAAHPWRDSSGSWHACAMYRQSRIPYHVQCMEWNSRMASAQDLDATFPYLDCDVIQFLMSIPGDVQSHDGAPRGLMRAAMRGVVPDRIVARCDKGEFTHLVNEGILQEFAGIRRLFDATALSVELGYVDGLALRNHLDAWQNAIDDATDASLANRIVDLCGLELFLRAFFGAGPEGMSDSSRAEIAAC